jgi:anti-sigma factor RsiW
VTHLGDHLSALIDGELSGTDLDRANAHLAACGACRDEAHALRRLKHDLRAIADICDAEGLTSRLLAMPSQDHIRQADQDLVLAGHPARHLGRAPSGRRRATARPAGRRRPADPYDSLVSRRPPRRRRRYVLWSTVSLVVVGIGTAAFGMGGSGGGTEPQITPQLEVFDMQHAATSGDVPFVDPADVPVRVPVVTARP